MTEQMCETEALRLRLERALASCLGEQMVLVWHAFLVARCAHAGQLRDQGTPYLLHPLRTALLLVEEFQICSADLIAAALLHDVVEDAEGVEIADLRRCFGTSIADTVGALTKPARGDRCKAEVTGEYYESLAQAGEAARIVKLADKLDNVRDVANSSRLKKRAETADEAEQLFDLLCPTLSDRWVGRQYQSLLEKARSVLDSVGGGPGPVLGAPVPRP